MTPRTIDRQHWLLLALLAVAVLAVGIGLRDPWPADEPRFSLIAREMVVTGEFWVPRRGGELYADKPPIFIWLTAAAIVITGSVRSRFLFPSLLAGLGTLLLVVDVVRRLHGPRQAWLSGFALLFTVLFTLQAKTAQIDMVLTFLTTLAIYGMLRHALLGPTRTWWLIAWAAVGLGILTKGVGFLPLLMLPAWLWLARRGRATPLSARQFGEGLLVLLIVLASWGLPMIVMTSTSGAADLAAYRDDILFRQTGTRYVAAWHHLSPWYFYVAEVLPWAWLPLVLALPWAIPAWSRRFIRLDSRTILPISTVVLIVIFFSLSPGKRGVYMLPTIPLLVIGLAPLLPGLIRRPGVQRAATATLALLGAAMLVPGVMGLLGLPAAIRLEQRYHVAPWPWLTLLGLTAAFLLFRLRVGRGIPALLIWLGLFWVAYSTFGYVQLDKVRSPRELMANVASITGPGAWLGMPDFDEEFLLQARQPAVHFGRATDPSAQFLRAFQWLKDEPGTRWMLIEQRRRDDLACARLDEARDLGYQNRDEWWLIPGTAFVSCQGSAIAAPIFTAPTTMTSALGTR